jgi:hypothetical protein
MTSTRANSAESGSRGDSVGGTGQPGHPGHPAPARHRVSKFVLWFGLFGAAAAWNIQLIVNYAVAAHACYPRYVPLPIPAYGETAFSVPLIVVSIAALVIGVAGLFCAIAGWRTTSAETGGGSHWLLDTGEGRTRFMAAAGIMTSSVFLLAILFHCAAVLLLRHC